MLEMLKPEGVNGTWRKVSTDKEGNITYRITLSGEDVATLNEHIFEDTSALTKQQNGKATTWQLRLTPSNNLFADAGEWKFTLHVGKILTSNGDQKGSTVVWTNPQQTLTADFKTGGSSSWLTILLIVLGVLILAGVVVFIVLSSKKKKPAAGMPLPSGNTCVKCGYPLADNIVYCPRCGTMRTVRQQAPAPMPVQTPVPPAVQAPTRQAGQPAPKYFCGKCGNELAEGVIYCPRCGTKRDGLPPSAKPPKLPKNNPH